MTEQEAEKRWLDVALAADFSLGPRMILAVDREAYRRGLADAREAVEERLPKVRAPDYLFPRKLERIRAATDKLNSVLAAIDRLRAAGKGGANG